MELTLLAALSFLGCFTGFLAGLFGIGGGMILTPFLTMLLSLSGAFPSDQIVHIAIATSMGTILFTSLSSLRAHARMGGVLWSAFWGLIPGILIGGLAGAHIAGALSAFWIALVFTTFVGFSATKIFISRSNSQGTRDMPGPAGLIASGFTIGTIASIVGAGGGFIIVPFLTWCRVSIHKAVGTSAALGFPVSLAGTIGYVISGWNVPELAGYDGLFGYIYWPALLAVALCSIFTAPMGAKLAHKLDSTRLKKLFGLMLYCLAGYMLYKAILAY